MKLAKVIIAVLFILAPLARAWDGGTTDTVETRYPNGQLEKQFQQFTYNGNERTYLYGFYRTWHENGQPHSEGQYIKDLEEGTWIYYDSTGRRIREVTYHNGLKNSYEIEWNANGTLSKELCFKDNKLHGLSTWFQSYSNIIDLFNNYCLNILTQSLYLEGDLVLPLTDSTSNLCLGGLNKGAYSYYNKTKDLWIEWDAKNIRFWVGKKIDGKKTGQWIMWSSTGDMLEAEYYRDGIKLE